MVQYVWRDDGESEQQTFTFVGTESLFPVLDETPMCSEIRVCICRRV